MKTITLTQGEALDLSFCLGATAPKSVPSLKELFDQDKIRAKFEKPVADLLEITRKYNQAVNEAQEEIANVDKDKRVEVARRVNARMKSQTEQVNKLRELEIAVDLSDEQSDYLQKHYMDRVAVSLSRLDYAVEIARKLGFDPEPKEEGKKKK